MATARETRQVATADESRWVSADLAAFPDDDERYEIIDGELYVSKAPSAAHQEVCTELARALKNWSNETGQGNTLIAPGLIFADDDDDVAPDLVWVASGRLAGLLDAAGHLHGAPDLVIEVLSPGPSNRARDRVHKRALYERRGVTEYWVVDPRLSQVEIYRREDERLRVVATRLIDETLHSPLLPGFSLAVRELFARIP